MEYQTIDPSYAVSRQITVDQVADIKAAGFKSVICNRPDGEDPGQPTVAEIKAAVEAAGLKFRHVPVNSGQPITAADAERMHKALEEVEGPVFAYCRSGTRSRNIYGPAQALGG
jgi:uncharacterized protein (TIGR01244 family)